MIYRKAIKKMQSWQKRHPKKALLVTGARQIGKTYLIREFGKKNYRNFIELNFITNPELKRIFDGSLDADRIVMNLSAMLGSPMIRGETLIFLDEIQECPNARTAIKFLVEDGRFDYIESGSLLGVRDAHVPSYRVGYEEILHMYPLDLEEFALAAGIQPEIIAYAGECFRQRVPADIPIHEVMLDLFLKYVIVGGMPAAVTTFLQTHDLAQVAELQHDIIEQYRQDMVKSATSSQAKILKIFDGIPSQLEEKNRRYKLASVNSNARMRDFADEFMWLNDAGVALPCYNLSEPKAPLKLNEQSRLFKLFLSDCGLLCAMSMNPRLQFSILKQEFTPNLGGIMENVFAQLLKTAGFQLNYLNHRNVGELDFVVEYGTEVLAVEIKSGKDYHSHAALSHALDVDEWALQEGLVFCRGNVERHDKVSYLPWYMAMFLTPPAPPALTQSFDYSKLRVPGKG